MSLHFHTWLARAWHRAVFRWRRRELDHELAEELEFHLALKEQAAGELSLSLIHI